MKFDFETIIDRTNTDSVAYGIDRYIEASWPGVKVKDGIDPIAMWIADMSFATAPSVVETIEKRLRHPLFGYFSAPDEYYDSIIRWYKIRHHYDGLTKENIGYENGVLGGLLTAMRVLCSDGDKVLLHSPTYVGFSGALGNVGYKMVLSDLKLDENNIYRMDFDDMEEKLSQGDIHVAIMCNPHNPSGRVWEKWELEKACALFEKYNVYIICDEIWSDLILPGYQHTPLFTVSEYAKTHSVTLCAPSKTFSLAGLVGAYHICFDQWMNARMAKESSNTHYNSMNLLSMYASIGAYTDTGAQWLDQLLTVIDENVNVALDYVHHRLSGVKVSKPQGTYMFFMDCEDYCKSHDIDIDTVQRRGIEHGVIWQDGRNFHGPYHIRLNLALPTALLKEALQRLVNDVFVD